MTYTVVWVADAEAELARLWMTFPNPQLLANAADEVDRVLRRMPLSVGRAGPQNSRVLHLPPTAVDYRVFPDDALVKVYAVWLSELDNPWVD